MVFCSNIHIEWHSIKHDYEIGYIVGGKYAEYIVLYEWKISPVNQLLNNIPVYVREKK